MEFRFVILLCIYIYIYLSHALNNFAFALQYPRAMLGSMGQMIPKLVLERGGGTIPYFPKI